MPIPKPIVISCTLSLLVILSASLLVGTMPSPVRAQNLCEQEKEILGLSLASPTDKEGNRLLELFASREKDQPLGLSVFSVEPLGSAARLGLRAGDVVQQANSWLIQTCRSYGQAITDAKRERKALLLLVARQGKMEAVAFAAEVWEEPEEKKAKEAVASLKTILKAPLPPPLKGKIEPVGKEVVVILRELETSAHLPNHLSLYEQSVNRAEDRIAALDYSVQGEAEKRMTAGAQVILTYYLDAERIWQYKIEQVAQLRPEASKQEKTMYTLPSFPYFYNSPVLDWVDRYPFLKASVVSAPRNLGFIERPGQWEPDKAILLLWQKAKEETDNLNQWLQGSVQSS